MTRTDHRGSHPLRDTDSHAHSDTPRSPAGYAQLFVDAWLRSSTDEPTSAQTQLAHSMGPNVELPGPAADAHTAPHTVTAMHSAPGPIRGPEVALQRERA